MMEDSLGDRMKKYEAEHEYSLSRDKPIYARIDGRSFSRFTRGMEKPYDKAMSDCMMNTAITLVNETKADSAYVQSDEISLVFRECQDDSTHFFGGRVQKLSSVIAGLTTAAFSREFYGSVIGKRGTLPHFDCRVCQPPTREEVTNMILWRHNDATRNAILNAGQSVFSHREMQGKKTNVVLDMLRDRNVNFNGYPSRFRNGAFVKSVTRIKSLSDEEMQRIPVDKRPVGKILRSTAEEISAEGFHRHKDRESVVFWKAFIDEYGVMSMSPV
jgi:tRNA(His) 5'-end guanylyltransferase